MVNTQKRKALDAVVRTAASDTRAMSPIPGTLAPSPAKKGKHPTTVAECLTFRGSKATLHLADGNSFKGFNFGAETDMDGEVVFK